MRIHARRSVWALAAACLVQSAAASSARAAEGAAELLLLGACTAAQQAADQALVATETQHDDAAIADALALRSRIALDCQRPGTPGLAEGLTRELELRTRIEGADSAAAAEVKLQTALLALYTNRIDDALAATQALDEQATRLQWPAALRARIANQISMMHNVRADAAAAFPAAERAIVLARAEHDDTTLMLALQNRAFATIRQRRSSEAMAPLAQADEIARARYGERSRERTDVLRFTAQAQRDTGDFGAAIDTLEQALAILHGLREPDQRRIASVLLNLGQTLKVSGDSERAVKIYEEALSADDKGPDPLQRVRPATLHGLANLERDSGHNERSLRRYAEAEQLFERGYGAQSPQLAQVLNNHGNAEANLGHFDAANALYQRSIDIARARNSIDPGDYLPLANLGMVKVWQARYADAERDFREMIGHQANVGVGSEANKLFSSMGLAASLWGRQKTDAAFDAAVEAEQLRQAALRLAASHLGERQAVNLQEYQRPSLDLVVSIALAGGKPAQLERAWELGMAAREQVTAIRAQRLAAARSTTDPKLAALWQTWRDASAAYARSELARVDAPQRHEAQLQLDRAERALAAATPLAAALASTSIDIKSVRRGLPAGNSLVLFTTSRMRLASDFAKEDVERRTPDLYAFMLSSPTAAVRALRLGPLDDITRDIDAWGAALADRDVTLASVAARGQLLRKTLWQPLTDAGAGRQWLVLATDALYRMPWGALPDADGYLIDRGFRAHVLNHERELLASRDAQRSPRLLAIADPSALGQSSIAQRGCTRPLPALPGARRESTALQTLWRARFGDDAGATVLAGADATEAHLRDHASTADVIHLGTHGVSLADDCNAPTNALATTRGFSLAADTPLDAAAPALAPAALLFAPGDGRGSDDDGVLTAEEIATLDLSRTQWAVLAACATAAGSTHRYEGLFGLARAFRLAGAHTVLTSLWPVDDGATAEWMQALYAARIERGLDTAASLAQAQQRVLAARRARGDSTHPYYWAAFVATGDWR
jgi:CHAT domain-containing protein/tetratricopeptide (TPR) repeat protein